jgi:carboxymethylenebutenolidase
MGGGFALMLAADHGFSVAGANYGGLTGDSERPWPARTRLSPATAPRIAGQECVSCPVFSGADRGRLDHDIKVYPDAGHGFLNDAATTRQNPRTTSGAAPTF